MTFLPQPENLQKNLDYVSKNFQNVLSLLTFSNIEYQIIYYTNAMAWAK